MMVGEMRTCNRCGESKREREFYHYTGDNGKRYATSYCQECRREYQRKYQLEYQRKKRERSRMKLHCHECKKEGTIYTLVWVKNDNPSLSEDLMCVRCANKSGREVRGINSQDVVMLLKEEDEEGCKCEL